MAKVDVDLNPREDNNRQRIADRAQLLLAVAHGLLGAVQIGGIG